MMNATSRLAVRIQHLPDWEVDWEVDWEDTKPQKSRRELKLLNVLPSEADGEEFHWRAVHVVMQFLVTQFDSLTDHRKHVSPEEQAFPPTKTDVAPM